MTDLKHTILAKATYDDMQHTLNLDKRKFKNAKKTYKILACSGDKSVGGMGRIATTYDIPLDKINDVDTYIDICEHWSTYAIMSMPFETRCDEYSEKVFDIYMNAHNLMEDIFQDKWDYRSSWCWVEYPEVA